MRIFSILAAMIFFLASCDMEPKNYTHEISKMEDTLFAAFPQAGRVSIEVRTDFGAELIITLGDASLYRASEKAQQEAAEKAAHISHAIFTTEKLPSKGKLIIVEEENTLVTDKSTWKEYPMNLAQFHKK
jgi:hypothetical protein